VSWQEVGTLAVGSGHLRNHVERRHRDELVLRHVQLEQPREPQYDAAAYLQLVAIGDQPAQLLEAIEELQRRQVVAREVDLLERALLNVHERPERPQLEVRVAEVER